jgi:hypothetical protein
VLLFLFHPIVDSLRALQQASELKSVQKKQAVPRTSWGSFTEARIVLGSADRSRRRGSFSEARQVFDPEWLKPIISELAQQTRPLARDPRLKDLTQRSPSGTAGPTRLIGRDYASTLIHDGLARSLGKHVPLTLPGVRTTPTMAVYVCDLAPR